MEEDMVILINIGVMAAVDIINVVMEVTREDHILRMVEEAITEIRIHKQIHMAQMLPGYHKTKVGDREEEEEVGTGEDHQLDTVLINIMAAEVLTGTEVAVEALGDTIHQDIREIADNE